MGEGEKEEEVKYLRYLSGSGIHADYSRQETFDRRLLRLIRGEARSSKGPDASMCASDPIHPCAGINYAQPVPKRERALKLAAFIR